MIISDRQIKYVWVISLALVSGAWLLAERWYDQGYWSRGFMAGYGGVVLLVFSLLLTALWSRTRVWERAMKREATRGGLVAGFIFWVVAVFWPFM